MVNTDTTRNPSPDDSIQSSKIKEVLRESIIGKLRFLRRIKGQSFDDVSIATEIGKSTLNDYETGHTLSTPPIESLYKLAKLWDVQIEFLINPRLNIMDYQLGNIKPFSESPEDFNFKEV